MFDNLSEVGSITGHTIEGIGVLIIVIGFIYAALSAFRNILKNARGEMMEGFRHNIKKTMLIGLDFLVAGDIIRTVTVEYTLSGVASLGLLVLIRTVLVFTIHLELEGRWPWQKEADKKS